MSFNTQDLQSNHLYINWLPPQTHFNTIVNGYNLSSSLPGVPSFTPMTNVLININDVDPCKEINITVIPFNGLEGDPAEITGIYLPSGLSEIVARSLKHRIQFD